jgi:hypothetical protein
MAGQRRIIEIFSDGEHIWEWDLWVKNYIAVMHDVHRGRGATNPSEHFTNTVYYIREPGSRTLSPALQLSDIPYNTHPKQPDDMHRVAFEDTDDHLYRPDNGRDYLHFDYSPSSGYEIPPEDVLKAPLTLAALKSYTKYYTEDREGYRAFKEADFGGYRLADKRSVDRGEYNDAWAITRGPQETREVYLVEGAWVPVTFVRWSTINDYPLFSFKLQSAIKMIGEFLADSQED